MHWPCLGQYKALVCSGILSRHLVSLCESMEIGSLFIHDSVRSVYILLKRLFLEYHLGLNLEMASNTENGTQKHIKTNISIHILLVCTSNTM